MGLLYMRFSTFQNLHELVALTPSKLDAMNGATKEDRIDILMRLIRDNKPLELAKGGTFTVTNITTSRDSGTTKYKKYHGSYEIVPGMWCAGTYAYRGINNDGMFYSVVLGKNILNWVFTDKNNFKNCEDGTENNNIFYMDKNILY